MKHELIEKSGTSATIKVSLSKERLGEVAADTFNKLRPRVKAAGFRAGKAPDHIIERELGTNVVQGEVLEAATSLSYAQAVKELNLSVVAPPKVSLEKFVPYDELEYTATVDVMPEIKLPDYKEIKLDFPPVELAPAEIEETIASLAKQTAAKSPMQRAAADGDEVVFDFEGTRDGQPVAGAKAEKYPLRLGSNAFIPGFEEQLIGLKPGAEKTFEIDFPADYHAQDLAGAKLQFKVKLHEVNELVPAEVDDAWAAKVGPFKSVAELRTDIETRLKEEKELQARRSFERQLMDRLIEQTDFEVPASLIHEQTHSLEHDFEHNLEHQGITREQYAKAQGKSEEQLAAELKEEAAKRVKISILLSEIARAEKLSISEADLAAEINRLKGLYTRPETQAELDSTETQREIKSSLLANKTLETIINYVKKT